MALVVDVPLNTMLADLDESLRVLLQRELSRHGFDGVNIAFEAPAKEWSSQLAAPTVDLFLYDLRESTEHRHRTIDERRGNGFARQTRPPLILECSYALTAWTQAVEDEHRLLSQLLTILHSYPRLPDDVLSGRLRNGYQRYPIIGRIGLPKADGKADFWNAVGGQYKASLDYVVTLACEAGAMLERGPEVRSVTVRVNDLEGPPGTITELHRAGGRVADADGAPAADAWVTLPDLGRWSSTEPNGHFTFAHVPPGEHRCIVRASDGTEAQGELQVPGRGADLVLGAPKPRRKTSAKR